MIRGIARSICTASPLVAIAALLVCVAASSFAIVSANVPRIEGFLNWAAQQYDVHLPEITIKDGHASIKEKQPYQVDTAGEKDVAIIIDTRQVKESEAVDYLGKVDAGAVLTRDSLVTKGGGQIRIIPLKDMPDFVFNSSNLQDFLDQFLPTAVRYGTILVIIYFLVVKPLQVLILGLIPYFGARTYSVALSYGEALKIASIVMVPPVVLDCLVQFTGIRLPAAFVLYFGVYIVLLCLSVRDLVKNPGPEEAATAGIAPS